MSLSRRSFMGGVVSTLGYLGVRPTGLQAQASADDLDLDQAMRQRIVDYSEAVKLSSNENPWGPLESSMKSMNSAWKYSNRYGYPDANVLRNIAEHHGVPTDHVLLGAGSGEILGVIGLTFLEGGKKVLGVEPTYNSVFARASRIKSDVIRLPLNKDYSQNIDAFVEGAQRHYRELGFVYLCNPNNPTGMIVSKDDVKRLLDGIPEDLPVLIDEAYHDYVRDPSYATSIPYVLEGRRVMIARTFSKIFGLAGMRLGYAIAPPDMINQMRPHSIASINALVKWGAVAGLQDTSGQDWVRNQTITNREQAMADIRSLGYKVLPSETNFFMVSIHREIRPVIQEFRKRGVLVGRPFPPMTQHMRVSVGTETDMAKFISAFREIFPQLNAGADA